MKPMKRRTRKKRRARSNPKVGRVRLLLDLRAQSEAEVVVRVAIEAEGVGEGSDQRLQTMWRSELTELSAGHNRQFQPGPEAWIIHSMFAHSKVCAKLSFTSYSTHTIEQELAINPQAAPQQ